MGDIACSKSEAPNQPVSTLQLSFSNYVNGQPMVLQQNTYQNAAGESFNITMFRYYVSNFSLTTSSGTSVALPPQYFLVSEDSARSKNITLEEVPEGTYSSISFLIGVDSVRNFSGAQTGALDPLYGMFWTWNSGYVMAKLEGTSPVSTMPNNLIEFHIGGFKGPNNVLRTVQLNFPQPVQVTQNGQAPVKISADAYTWFNQPNPISFQQVASCHTAGAQAAAIADNYKTMFSIQPN
jgi:hypothetical protein